MKQREGISLKDWISAVLPALAHEEVDDKLFSLLTEARVVCNADTAGPPRAISPDQTDTHSSAVNDVLRTLVAQKKNSPETDNVLASGLWIGESGGIQCFWPNSAVNVIRARTWALLHEHIGTELFRFLMLKTTVLVPNNGDNGGYLQVSGSRNTKQLKNNTKKNSNNNAIIERWRIFYHGRFIRKAGFEPGHILSLTSCEPTQQFANKLCRAIFDLPSGQRMHRRYALVRPLLFKMACKQVFGKVRYGLLLQTICPLSDHSMETPHHLVTNFVWACICKLVPKALLVDGNLAYSMISQFVRLRRYEVFDLQHHANRWPLIQCQWLPKSRTPGQFRVHRQMMLQWLTWFMNVLVVPLISDHFYVTESAVQGHGTHVFYFRKPVWKKLVDEAGIVQRLHLDAPPRISAVTSRLRMMPKTGPREMRVIARVKQNNRLRTVLQVMRWELERNPGLLGASVFGFHDVFERFSAFKARTDIQGPWFIVKIDAKQAFDLIRQDVLCRIISESGLFTQEHYFVHRYRVNGKLVLRVSTEPWGSPPEAKRDQVVTDCAWGESLSRADLYSILFEHIRLNVVLLQGRRLRQTVGIPQGSILSSHLCSIYYGFIERTFLSQLPGLMMRWIDDTIFITHREDAALGFIETLQSSECRALVTMSLDKACANFSQDYIQVRRDGFIAWCGLLFDTQTLEVRWDYARYEGTHISDTLTAPSSLGHELASKLKQYVKAKCVAVLMSRQINGHSVILLNLYQMFLYVAMKFHCLIARHTDSMNHEFLFRVVQELVEWTHVLVRNVSPQCIQFLAGRAFYVILLKHNSIPLYCRHLLPALASLCDHMADQMLLDVTDWSLSTVFERIAF